jgi:hypothetical protein
MPPSNNKLTRAEFLRLYKKQQDIGQKYGRLVANTLIGEPTDAAKMQSYFQEWLQLEKEMQKEITDPTPSPAAKGGRRKTRRRRKTRYSSSSV